MGRGVRGEESSDQRQGQSRVGDLSIEADKQDIEEIKQRGLFSGGDQSLVRQALAPITTTNSSLSSQYMSANEETVLNIKLDMQLDSQSSSPSLLRHRLLPSPTRVRHSIHNRRRYSSCFVNIA